jgi:hypothetical protein
LTSLSIQSNLDSVVEQQQQQQQQQVCRSAASAITSTLEDWLQRTPTFISVLKNSSTVVLIRHVVLSILLVHRNIVLNHPTNLTNDTPEVHIDIHIVTNLARLLEMDNCYCCHLTNSGDHHSNDDDDNSLLADVVTFAITNVLRLSNDSNSSNRNVYYVDDAIHSVGQNGANISNKRYTEITVLESSRPDPSLLNTGQVEGTTTNVDALTTIFSMASQFRPWHRIDAVLLVHIAMKHLLWHSAEKVCISVTTCDPQWLSRPTMGIDTVSTYVDLAIQRRAHRQADKIATAFFDALAIPNNDLLEPYFLNARYLHACNTIIKLIRRGAIPVIERQVERIDYSVLKVKEFRQSQSIIDANVDLLLLPDRKNEEPFYEGGTTLHGASKDIRNFALQKLEESGNMDAAHRFATLWGLDYVLDPEVMKLAEQRRKALYLQWEDVFPHQPMVPDLITTPAALDEAMMMMMMMMMMLGTTTQTVYGFDVEWGNDDDTGIVGAAILQIATVDRVILVDMTTLSKSNAGVEALERHINTLFHNPNNKMIGFCCREDLSKLRSSPCIRKE